MSEPTGDTVTLLTQIKDQILAFVQANEAYLVPSIFAMALAESIIGLSFFVPSTVVFLGIGALHAAAGGELWGIWLAASIGATAGDAISYAFGARYSGNVQHMWPLKRFPTLLPQTVRVFDRWGWLAVLAGKFTGFMRPIIPIVAGITHMPLHWFLLASFLSSMAWALATLGPGFGLRWAVQ
ncbi:MAG: DedA family protein [Pseudomonadota bacterium]